MQKLLIAFLFTVSFVTYSQNKLTDSLIDVLKASINDADKAKTLNAISNAFKTSDPNEVISYATKALELSKSKNITIQEGFAYINLGTGNIILGHYDKSLNYFYLAKSVFEIVLKDKKDVTAQKGLAKAYGSIGVVSSEQNNYAKAFRFYLKSITIYEALNDKKMLSKLYNNVGVAYKSQDKIDEALLYFSKAIVLQKEAHQLNGITLTNIANCYLQKQQYEEAKNYYDQAKPIVNEDPRALGEWYNNVGLYYKEHGDNAKAMQNWNLAIKAFTSIQDKFGIADTYFYKSQLLLEQRKYDEALLNANLTLQLANETQVIEQIAISQKRLSKIYEQKKQFKKALEYQKLYNITNDSLVNAKSIRNIVQAEMNFEFEKRENSKKTELEKQQLLSAEKSKQRRNQFIFGTVGLIMLLGFGFLLYNRKQLKLRLTLQKELAEYEQKALHLQMNPHFIFNCLGAISGFIINNGTDHAIKYLAKFSKLMRLTLEYSQESLIPIGKEIESLQNYLELEQLRFNNAFQFKITKSDALEDDVAISPLLIQPLVENAIIHGVIAKKNNGEIEVNFSIIDDTFQCQIIDNGVGIEESLKLKENSMQIHKSMALNIIKKRLLMLAKATGKNAGLSSKQRHDSPGNSIGTTVTVNLPIQYKE